MIIEVKEFNTAQTDMYNYMAYPGSGFYNNNGIIISVSKSNMCLHLGSVNDFNFKEDIKSDENKSVVSESLFLKTITILSDKDKYPLK